MSGAEKIAQERRRQIERLGFGPEHDSMHTSDELRSAALAVLTRDETLWPWNDGWKDARSTHDELVVAGALIAAALDVRGVETPEAAVEAGADALAWFLLDDRPAAMNGAAAVLNAAIPVLRAQGWTPPGGTE